MPVQFVVILGVLHALLHDIFCIYYVWFNNLTSMYIYMYHIWQRSVI